MTPAQALPRSPWSLLLLLIANWIAFGNIVSVSGLFSWVIIPTVITVQVMLVMIHADRRILAGFVLLLLSAIAVGLSQLIGGTLSGPITRSTLMMTTCSGLMVLLWRTRYPTTAAIVSLAALCGALGLGAAQRIVWVVGVWTVAVVAYLVAVGPLRTDDLRDKGRLRRFIVLLLAGGVLATLAGNGLSQIMQDPWRLQQIGPLALGGTGITSAQAASTPAPLNAPKSLRGSGRNMSQRTKGLDSVDVVTGSTSGMSEYRPTPVPDYVPLPSQTAGPRSLLATVILAVAALLLLLVVLLAFWIGSVQLKWLVLRKHLRSGTPPEQVAGAWHWLRQRWAQSGYVEYADLTPDRMFRLAAAEGDSMLAELAHITTQALYSGAPELDATDAQQAWQSARMLRTRHAGTVSVGFLSLLITPAEANKRMVIHARQVPLTTAPPSHPKPPAPMKRRVRFDNAP